MGMLGVVVVPPGFDRQLRLGHRYKPMGVQAFVAEPAVEALDEGVLRRLPRLDEGERDAAAVSPRIEHPASELRPVVDDDGTGQGTPQGQLRSEEHTSELQSRLHLVCRLLLEKKKKTQHKT